jgi:hypothetical protein
MLKLDVCRLVFPELGGKNVKGIERPIAVVHETPCGNKPEIPPEIIVGVILEDELNLNVIRSAVSRYSSHKLFISASCILRQTKCLSEAADKQPAKRKARVPEGIDFRRGSIVLREARDSVRAGLVSARKYRSSNMSTER